MQTTAVNLPPFNSTARTRNQPWRRFGSSRCNHAFSATLKACLSLAACFLSIPIFAQSPATEPALEAGSAAVLSLVRWNGSLPEAAGRTVQLRFALYQDQAGGLALWSETQTVAVGVDGKYSVLLGATSAEGLPQGLFQAGEARWIEARLLSGEIADAAASATENAPARSLLAAVPYAVKSADAETLAGRPATDYVTREDLQSAVAANVQPAAQPNPQVTLALSGTGVADYVPLWTNSTTLGNSAIVQNGSDIGIGTATPATTLDVNGGSTLRSSVILPSKLATATSTANSPALEMQASSYSSTSSAAVAQTFAFAAFSEGNDTASPSAVLELLFGSGTTSPKGTGLSFAPTGLITFASGQKFPGTGTGTITGITTNSPLTGYGFSGSVALGLSTAALETTLNTVYPQLTAANTFHNSQTIDGSLTTTGAITTTGVTASGVLEGVGGFLSNNTVQLKPANAATSSTGYNSPALEFGASAYNSSSVAAVAQELSWQAVVSGNDTSTPTANLALLAGSGGTQSPTGFSISEKGIINWATGQTFPITGTGGGTITGITTTSPLTGSGTSGSVALGLNQSALVTDITPSLETTFDSRYALLSGGDIFSKYLEAYQTAGPGNAAVLGWGSSASVGVFGDSDTGFGLQGESTSGHGVYAQVTTPAAGSSGVLGFTGTTFSASYSSEAGIANAGVWADNSKAGTGVPVALFATGDDTYGAAIVTNGADYPTLFATNNGGTAGIFTSSSGDGLNASTSSGTGLYGSTSGGGNGVEGFNTSTSEQDAGVLGVANTASVTYGGFNVYAGVWGDTGTSSTTVAPAWAIGVLGTADDGHAGVFLNNSSGWSTMYVSNASSGGTGLFKTFMATSADGACGIGSGGSLSCTGQIKSLVSAGNGARTVETYALQSPENWMEDFGSGQLENGVAVVRIDPAFAETVTADSSYHVFLTPNGDSKGLYVISKTPSTFEVRESGGGTSSLAFDYRIVARRRGYEAQRLVDVTERFNTEMRAASMVRSSGTRHAPARPDLKKSPLQAALGAHPRRLLAQPAPIPHKPLARPGSTTAPRP